MFEHHTVQCWNETQFAYSNTSFKKHFFIRIYVRRERALMRLCPRLYTFADQLSCVVYWTTYILHPTFLNRHIRYTISSGLFGDDTIIFRWVLNSLDQMDRKLQETLTWFARIDIATIMYASSMDVRWYTFWLENVIDFL